MGVLWKFGELFAGQVQRLVEVAEASNEVTLQVLPRSTGLHAGMGGPFVILDYEEPSETIVFLEMNTDGLYLDRTQEVYRYRRLFEQAQSIASGPQESADIMRAMIT